jgi:hypothetical protein
LQVYVCTGAEGRVETPYIYTIIKRALAAHVPLFLTPRKSPETKGPVDSLIPNIVGGIFGP